MTEKPEGGCGVHQDSAPRCEEGGCNADIQD